MTHTISLIYGDHVMDDLDFCEKHNEAILRYGHGIMTLQGSSREIVQTVARDPFSMPGFVSLLESHPEDVEILKDFFGRFLRYYGLAAKHGPNAVAFTDAQRESEGVNKK